jgi:hypothetical protein
LQTEGGDSEEEFQPNPKWLKKEFQAAAYAAAAQKLRRAGLGPAAGGAGAGAGGAGAGAEETVAGLTELRRSGAITEAEFRARKQALKAARRTPRGGRHPQAAAGPAAGPPLAGSTLAQPAAGAAVGGGDGGGGGGGGGGSWKRLPGLDKVAMAAGGMFNMDGSTVGRPSLTGRPSHSSLTQAAPTFHPGPPQSLRAPVNRAGPQSIVLGPSQSCWAQVNRAGPQSIVLAPVNRAGPKSAPVTCPSPKPWMVDRPIPACPLSGASRDGPQAVSSLAHPPRRTRLASA